MTKKSVRSSTEPQKMRTRTRLSRKCKAAPPPQKDPNATPFLELSAELRNTIYEMALTSGDGVDVCTAAYSTELALLQTCRQIRQEATAMFYASNSFRLKITPKTINIITRWLNDLDTSRAHLIPKIIFEADISDVVPEPEFRHESGLLSRITWQRGRGALAIDHAEIIATALREAAGRGLRPNVIVPLSSKVLRITFTCNAPYARNLHVCFNRIIAHIKRGSDGPVGMAWFIPT